MRQQRLRDDKFWKTTAYIRKTDGIFILKTKGKTKSNKENGRVIHLDKEERKKLFDFLSGWYSYPEITQLTDSGGKGK